MSSSKYVFETLKESVVTEINRLRADPACYVPILEQYMQYIKDDNIIYKPNRTPVETYEGINAYQEAIRFLKKQKPLQTLTYDERLHLACNDHAKDIGPKGLYSHENTEGRNTSERIEKYCEWELACAENIVLGCHTGVEVVIALLVDDGVPRRIHRQNIFREEITHFGVAAAAHRDYEVVVVINLVGGIRDLGRPFFDKSTFKYDFPTELNLFDQSKKGAKKPRKAKSSYQLEDENAPDGTVEMKLKKETRLWEGKKNKVTRKYYTLNNGSRHVVEVEDL